MGSTLREALLANSYDYDSMKLSIRKTLENSYSYLYKLQQAYIGYEEIHYTSSEESHRLETTETVKGFYNPEDESYYVPNATGGYQHYTKDDVALEDEIETKVEMYRRVRADKLEIKYYEITKHEIIPNVSGNLYLDKSGRACFNCDYNLISGENRKEYRLGKFYQKEISFDEMVENKSIFNKLPIVILDNQCLFDFKVKILNENNMTIILPFTSGYKYTYTGERAEDDNRLLFATHNIKVIVIDNVYFQRVSTNTSNKKIVKGYLNVNKNGKYIKIPKEWFTGLTTNKLLSKRTGEMFCTLHFTDVIGNTPQLESSLIRLESTDKTYYTAYLTDYEYTSLVNYNSYIEVSLIFFYKLHMHTFYTGNNYTSPDSKGNIDYMVIQEAEKKEYAAPVPIENFMILKVTSDDYKEVLDHNTYLNMYYPNIYHINEEDVDSDVKYEVYYFYYDITGLRHFLLQSFFYAYLRIEFEFETGYDTMESIINALIYNRVTEHAFSKEYIKYQMLYDYPTHKFGDIDYIKRYLEENDDKVPWNYFEETLKEWIRIDPFVLRDYVYQQKVMNNYYHMYTNQLYLKNRERNDTSEEMPDRAVTTFDETMYVFAISSIQASPKNLETRVFVDGLMVEDVQQITYKALDYLYIPTHYVTDDSFIEVEVFPEYIFKSEQTFESTSDTKTIFLVQKDGIIKPTLADLYFVNEETGFIIDNSLFDVNVVFKEGTFDIEPIDTDEHDIVFTNLVVIEVTPVSEEVLDTKITVRVTKDPCGVNFKTVGDGYPYVILSQDEFNGSDEYIRLFKDGRLIPRSKYKIFPFKQYFVFVIYELFAEGENLYVDITPYRYKEIYYQEELSPDTTLIDLRGIITKPFDIRYYDVFLNGRRLTLNNVWTITPWEITLTNLHSKYNLVIYERDRDWEYFGLDYTTNIYYFSPDDILNDSRVSDYNKNEFIKELIEASKDDECTIYPNVDDEDKLDYDEPDVDLIPIIEMWIFYYMELIPKTYLNPTYLQESTTLMETYYPDVHEVYGQTDEDPVIINLDANLVYNETEDTDNIAVYTVGHLDEEIDEDFGSQSVIQMTD